MACSVALAKAGLSPCVPDIAVAMDAVLHLAIGFRGKHVVNKVIVAIQTRVLGHAPVAFFDLDWLVKIA